MTLVPNRAFLRLWSAESISLFGSQITLLAVPLTAVLTLHATPLQMGVLMAVGTAPTLLFGLVIGAWVDRVRRRPLMIAADVARAALLVTIPVASYAQLLHIGQLYIVEFLTGVCTIVFDVAYSSLLPALVPHEFLVSGNSRLEGSRALAGTAGPGLAGALVQLVTGPVAILGDALSFVVSAGILRGIRTENAVVERPDDEPEMGEAIVAGVRLLFGDGILRALALSSATFNLFDALLFAVYVLYMVRGLHLGPASVGAVFGLGGLGALLGSLVAGPLAARVGLGRLMVWAVVAAGAAELAIGLAAGPRLLRLAILVAAEGTVQLSAIIYRVNSVSLRQAITPAGIMGRVNATSRVLTNGVGPIGSIAGGLLGGTIGLRDTVLLAGTGTMLSFCWLALSPVRKLRNLKGHGVTAPVQGT